MRVYVAQRYVVIDGRSQHPIARNACWHLACGGGFYGMHVLWPYGGVLQGRAWGLSMN